MKRISLTDGSGQWFDKDKATCYDENSDWNGHNHVSRATGDQFEHEKIYMTASGQFVLHHWSQWEGVLDTWELIDKERAAKWFAKQGFQDDEIPDEFLEEVAKMEVL